MLPKLPFSKEELNQMIDSKLAPASQVQPTGQLSIAERLKLAAWKFKNPTQGR